ncbi:hypothetical protein ACFX1R_014416 [Malus domestica]
MAPFIFQLNECNKCKDFIDRNAIKTLRFERNLNTTHQILGPLFKDAVPSSITNLFKEHCLAHLLQGFDWWKWCLTKPQGAWPLTTANWATWVVRMEKFFGKKWEALGIHDAIKLSTMEITMDKELLMAALSLWCSATNTMVLPFSPITPTILDISAILGTSPSGIPIDATFIGCPSNLDLKALFDEWVVKTLSQESQEPSKEEVQKLHKNFLNYNTLIHHFAGRGRRVCGRANIRPSYFTGTTSLSVVLSQISVWSKMCQWRKPWLLVTLWRSVRLSLPTFCAAWLKQPSTRSIHSRTDLSGYSNSACRFISPHFGQKSPTSNPLPHSSFNWLLDQCLLTKLKKFSNTYLPRCHFRQ